MGDVLDWVLLDGYEVEVEYPAEYQMVKEFRGLCSDMSFDALDTTDPKAQRLNELCRVVERVPAAVYAGIVASS